MRFVFSFILFFLLGAIQAQTWNPDFWYLEIARRNQLLGKDTLNRSFSLRSFSADPLDTVNQQIGTGAIPKSIEVFQTPLFLSSRLLTKRPYGYGDFGLIPSPGFQVAAVSGVSIRYKFLRLDVQPEFVFATNNSYTGYDSSFPISIHQDKYYFWNNSDYPERFGNGIYSRLGWGQSSLTASFGSFETGISTKNIWWGPGQWNSLIFSTNAPGFPHFTFRTKSPARTFLGNFEGEIISGRLENSGYPALQDDALNDQFFRPFTGDWRYLNGITFNYSPKWINGLSIGFSRTFQVYSENMGNTFGDYFPIFEAFQKEEFFQDGNSVIFDGNGRDQQVSIFARIFIPKGQAEFYFEYGKRDHNFNWREFILNPEHARAFLMGFNKIFDSGYKNYKIQLRSEITHQQESVNRILRYSPKGGLTWHTHTRARGFGHLGQPLGVGLGIGANSQIVELALVDQINKMGFFLERIENQEDLFYRSFGEQSERKPWVDLSLGFLYDKQFNYLLLSSKLQLIHARNYQWQLDPASTPDFPKGKNLTSVMAQASVVYFWNKD